MPGLSRRLPPQLIDVVLALAFAGFWLSAEAGRLAYEGGPVRAALIVLIAVVVGTSGAAPALGLLTAAAVTALALLGADAGLSGAWPLVAGLVYAAARSATRPQVRVRAVLAVALPAAAAALAFRAEGPAPAAALAGLVALGLAGGLLVRLLRERARLLAEQRALERNLEDAGRELSLIAERTRIARDVHDIMAQSLSIVLAQADGAVRLVRTRPDRAESSFAVISDVARTSLVEVRMLIESIGPSAVTLDQPTLENLPQLLKRFDAAGLVVGFCESGEPLTLSDGQQLAVYRIVQEALTNALRHSGDHPNAFLRLLWDGTALLLEITSRGHPGREPSIGSGMGIVGMKERAELAGGWLTAEDADGGETFIVTASIPAPPRGAGA
ncbi:hypothetical protein GSU68_02465 [Rathayibacter sp. VKM Ac-2759]|uniref:sensor histidine kinase n=1 Tax=Rathayibacter sp. VKM Ac-2759 TaxID=2609252 RepID=UPI0013181BA8|nr:histidine kinase [Rathayibacter sp. VKM Ac-2759]QHC65556.1 hypothetical protein GSU68_02465 [Rathayibacter sp. VKM Ac-2759]